MLCVQIQTIRWKFANSKNLRHENIDEAPRAVGRRHPKCAEKISNPSSPHTIHLASIDRLAPSSLWATYLYRRFIFQVPIQGTLHTSLPTFLRLLLLERLPTTTEARPTFPPDYHLHLLWLTFREWVAMVWLDRDPCTDLLSQTPPRRRRTVPPQKTRARSDLRNLSLSWPS